MPRAPALLRASSAAGGLAEPAPVCRAGLYLPGLARRRRRCARDRRAPDARSRRSSSTARWSRRGTRRRSMRWSRRSSAAGLNALPIYVSSLQGPDRRRLLREAVRADAARRHPQRHRLRRRRAGDGRDGSRSASTRRLPGAPGRSCRRRAEAPWRDGTAGSSARDLAMNVALPELDGRIITRAVVVQGRERHDARHRMRHRRPIAPRTASPSSPSSPPPGPAAPHPRRPSAASPWSSPTTPTATAASPTASASTRRRAPSRSCDALREAGYAVAMHPSSGDALIDALLAGPTNAIASRRARASRHCPLRPTTDASFAALPGTCRAQIAGKRWGAPEGDPLRPRRRVPSAALHRFGNVVGRLQPARGYHIDPKATLPRSGPRAAARLSRLLSLAAPELRRPRRRPLSASTAISNGCRARRWRSTRECCPEARWARCRSSIPSSSTIRARAPRPSAAPAP